MIYAFRSIQIFIAAYEERSFSAAAIRESATQPGISQHIQSLEQMLGVSLFKRRRYEVSPTPAADVFYQYCLEALRALETARVAVQPFANSIAGEITFGLTPTLSGEAFLAAFARFQAEFPNVRVSIHELSGPRGASAHPCRQTGLRDHASVGDLGRAEANVFASIPEVFVSSAASGRRPYAPVSAPELRDIMLVLPPRDFARRVLLGAYLNTHGARVARVLEMNSLSSLPLVADSEWVTILPLTAAWNSVSPARNLVVQPLADPLLSVEWVVVEPYQKGRTEAAKLFISHLADEVRAITDQWEKAIAPHGGSKRQKSAKATKIKRRRP